MADKMGWAFMANVLIGVILGLIVVVGVPGLVAFVTMVRSFQREK